MIIIYLIIGVIVAIGAILEDLADGNDIYHMLSVKELLYVCLLVIGWLPVIIVYECTHKRYEG